MVLRGHGGIPSRQLPWRMVTSTFGLLRHRRRVPPIRGGLIFPLDIRYPSTTTPFRTAQKISVTMVGHHKVDDSDNGILFTEDYNYDCMENEQDAPDARSDNFMFDDFSAEDSDNIVFEDSDGEDSDNFVLDSSPEKKAGVTPTHLPAVTQNLSTPLTKRIPFERSSLNKQQSLASASSLPPAPPTVPKPNAPLNGLQHSKHANPPATPSASSTTRNINASSQPPKVESTPPPKKLAPPTTEHPVAHFYPSAPSILFDSSQPKQQLQYLRNISSGYINSQLQVHNRNGVVHAEITVSTKHFGVIVSEAQDQDSITATSAAVATLITKLNASGCLQDVLLPLTLSKATPQEVDACAHLPKLIYEYGASLNAIPNVTHCTVSPR
ncbi:hypothetical protein EJ08DRAFT_376827 [Tothia fuscella]|uniref:Uncharacterized protein n=1 Tax=Tothia fuscella TaxID=1048955 RepID=A0A9P4NLA3_9PEZI|nr:hypothetical protein EJ08DRAFT_376827 [Tothia fuscella]